MCGCMNMILHWKRSDSTQQGVDNCINWKKEISQTTEFIVAISPYTIGEKPNRKGQNGALKTQRVLVAQLWCRNGIRVCRGIWKLTRVHLLVGNCTQEPGVAIPCSWLPLLRAESEAPGITWCHNRGAGSWEGKWKWKDDRHWPKGPNQCLCSVSWS